MKLQDLKKGQQFRFASGSKKGTYYIVSPFPSLVYSAINGHIEYKPKNANVFSRDVVLVSDVEPPVQIEFFDTDGDKAVFTTETEADFVHVLVKDTDGNSAISALSREQAIELVSFIELHLRFK